MVVWVRGVVTSRALIAVGCFAEALFWSLRIVVLW